MKPGERIRLITESTNVLVKKAFSEAQLILDQFGFQTYEPNYGYQDADEKTYFVGQVKVGSDSQLTDLHTYLMGLDAALPSELEANQPWGTFPLRLFFSHKYEEREFVGRVKNLLTDYGVDAFVAHNDINPSEIWRSSIKTALSTCDALVALMHPDFHESEWCDQEVGWALGRDLPVAAIRRQSDVRTKDGFLEERQDITLGVDQSSSESFLAREILLLMLNDFRTHEKGLHALAEALVNSRSFENTRFLWPLIAQEPRWEVEQLRRMEYAVATNPQVYQANVNYVMIPILLKKLVEKFAPTQVEPEEDPWNSGAPF